MANKTFRRDKLRRLAIEGRLVCLGRYYSSSGFQEAKTELPVAFHSEGGSGAEGFVTLGPRTFTTKCGSAEEAEDGTVSLYIVSGVGYRFRILPEQKKGKK